MDDDEARVRFPVSCPICRKELIAEYRPTDIVGALINNRPIRLYAACHDKSWNASYVEVQQIRAHLGAARVGTNRRAEVKSIGDTTDD